MGRGSSNEKYFMEIEKLHCLKNFGISMDGSPKT
jgi:hypothetical protein